MKPNIGSILFLDIETVSGKISYTELDDTFKKLWKLKARSVLRKFDEEITEEEAETTYSDRAGIFAEFGKIVCISVGIVYRKKEDKKLAIRLKSFADDDESKLLKDFSELLNQHYSSPLKHNICGHNIREFDVPYMCRRLIINQLPLPALLDIAGKKPWETKHLVDTLEFWKFGDYKNYTSLKLLAAVFGIPSPKDDIDGSEVGGVYWNEKDLPRIATYCEKDVLATAQLYLKYNLMPLFEEENVLFVD